MTELGADVRDAVLVVGSHGGLIACYLGASAGAHALLLNDAGVGFEGAGIAGLVQLVLIGMAAATVSNLSARIGNGQDSLARGVISHVNRATTQAGVVAGISAQAAATLLRAAPPAHSRPLLYADGAGGLACRAPPRSGRSTRPASW